MNNVAQREVDALLRKAQRSLATAKLIPDASQTDFAASRAYYGFFYVAEALLPSKHSMYESSWVKGSRGRFTEYPKPFFWPRFLIRPVPGVG